MRLNELGEVVKRQWVQAGVVRTNVELDEFQIMPNHFHGIIVLNDNVGATRRVARFPETRRVARFPETRRVTGEKGRSTESPLQKPLQKTFPARGPVQ